MGVTVDLSFVSDADRAVAILRPRDLTQLTAYARVHDIGRPRSQRYVTSSILR